MRNCCAHLEEKFLSQLQRRILCDLHRERSLVVPCPLTWHRGAAAFLRQRIGVAADAATRAECHVNGHGTTTRRHFPFLRIWPRYARRSRFAFRRVLLYLCIANKDKCLYGALFSCPKGTSTVWATVFSVAQTVKTVAQTVWRDWATAKSEGETGKFAVDTVKLS